MGAAKISMERVLAARPDINVLDLATEAVEDHIRSNGCAFEEDAAVRAVQRSGVSQVARAQDLPSEKLAELGDLLESMETDCAHKT